MGSLQTDHDLLVRIDERSRAYEHRMDGFDVKMDNHLKHHFRYNILAWTVALGAIVSLILVILR